jgi:hypothetical protein
MKIRWLCLAAAWALAPVAARAAGPDPYKGADALALRIDRHLAKGWADAKAVPARPADDAEFARRVYLDLAGRIPSVTEVRTFLDDRRADRRQKLVEKLLDGPRYTTHFTNVYRALMLPEAGANIQARVQGPGFEAWLRDQLQKNAPYDAMVRELMTTPVGGPGGRGGFFPGGPQRNPAAFYFVKDLKPEEIAAASARLFLGVNVGCAQCHHHPFAHWRKEQFWSFAAFFAGIQGRRQGDFTQPLPEDPSKRELTIPGSEKVAKAKFLDGKEPKWEGKGNTRAVLAEWMTRPDNPYFARAAVNRTWAYLFGHGLIEPVDEMVGTDNAATHPELLDELAREFAAHKFDLKFLLRVLTSTRAYQLSSARSHPSQDDPKMFAKAPLRGLTAEQLFDSVAMATGFQEGGGPRNPFFFAPNGPRQEFLTRFGNASDRAVDVQTSILQALMLMNGQVIARSTTLQSSETLAAIADAPFLDTAGKIEALFLATLSRKPTSGELARYTRHIEGATRAKGIRPGERERRSNEALADVFWVLLNSGEFFLNH